MVKIQKRQLTRNELVALNFIILGISLHIHANRALIISSRIIYSYLISPTMELRN